MSTIASRYELGLKLGWGAWFNVYQARDLSDDKNVVVKLMHDFLSEDSAFVTRLMAVLPSIRALSHSNLVAILDYGDDVDGCWTAEEYLAGPSLGALLRKGAIELVTGVRFAAKVLDALAAIHDSGVVHGCVHPNAVRIDPAGEPKLGDAGYSTADTGHIGPRRMDTVDYHNVYWAPEVLNGEPPTPASDIYGAGMLFAICMQAGADVTAKPEWWPQAIDVVARATNSDPRRRYSSAADLAAAVRRLPPAALTAWS